MSRLHNRSANALRPLILTLDVNRHAEGSCMITCGDTQVLCTASLEDKVPPFLKGSGSGWITAEYGMLPRATHERVEREAKKGQGGRTHEIQRLIGRALRSVVDLKQMGESTVKIDCDVLQADGGTRTAAITGGFVALYGALQKLAARKNIPLPITDFVAAISCGLVAGESLLDLDYTEDSTAQADANFVITGKGLLVEIQATAEKTPFSPDILMTLLGLAQGGIKDLIRQQQAVLLQHKPL